MAEMNLEQQRAVAIATARLRLQQQEGDAPGTNEAVVAAFGKPGKEQPSILGRIGNAAMRGSLPFGPAGALAGAVREGTDVASELYKKGAYEAGGLVTDITGSPGAGFATNVGLQAIPSLVGMGGKTAPLLESPARRLMQSAVKPSKAARETGQAEQAIGTMLEKDINATRGGMESQIALRDRLESKVDDILKNSKAAIDPESTALKTLKESISKITHRDDPVAEMQIISDSVNRFLSHPLVEGAKNISVKVANDLKKGLYEELRLAKASGVYGQGKGLQPTEVASLRDRASNLREAIGKAEPSVVPTLAEQAEAINVIKTLQPQVSREGNKMILGFGALSPRIENAVIWVLDRSPWAKSFLARSIYTGGKHAPAAGITVGTATQDQQQ